MTVAAFRRRIRKSPGRRSDQEMQIAASEHPKMTELVAHVELRDADLDRLGSAVHHGPDSDRDHDNVETQGGYHGREDRTD